jgi:nucleoside-diphosphate-sugar epimerase
MADNGSTKVLMTGGSGYLGGWCIAALLERGYSVRTTIRDLAREDHVRAQVAAAGVEAGERLEVLAADLHRDDGWADAVAGCGYVLHTASPFPPKQPKDPEELIVPARDGAKRVIRAALDADVERIVMTSSVAAVRGGHSGPVDGGEEFNENDWTDLDDPSITPYTRSKTIAEQNAWVLVDDAGARDRLAVINPGAIIGPLLSDDASFSLQLIERLLTGMPAIPRLGFSFVDVRDVADAHVRAMEKESAGGDRYITVDRFMWMSEVAAILKDRLGERAKKVPTRNAPDLLIKAIGIFDPAVRTITGDLGQKPMLSNERARERLGWSPRPIEDSIAETAESLFEQGIVKG